MSNDKMIKNLQLLRPTAAQNCIKESVQIAQGDLRKAQTHIDVYSDLADKGAHVYLGPEMCYVVVFKSLWTTMNGSGSLKISVK